MPGGLGAGAQEEVKEAQSATEAELSSRKSRVPCSSRRWSGKKISKSATVNARLSPGLGLAIHVWMPDPVPVADVECRTRWHGALGLDKQNVPCSFGLTQR